MRDKKCSEDTPVPAAIPEHCRKNFHMLLRAADCGDLAVLSAVRRLDEKQVALLVAIQRNGDGTFDLVPFAEMIDVDPFELYHDPTV